LCQCHSIKRHLGRRGDKSYDLVVVGVEKNHVFEMQPQKLEGAFMITQGEVRTSTATQGKKERSLKKRGISVWCREKGFER